MSDPVSWAELIAALVGTNGVTGVLSYRAASLKERRERYSDVQAAAAKFDKSELSVDEFKRIALKAGVRPSVVNAYTSGIRSDVRVRILEDYLWHPWSRRFGAIRRAWSVRGGLGE